MKTKIDDLEKTYQLCKSMGNIKEDAKILTGDRHFKDIPRAIMLS
ncbi:MAG: hypothetical protein Q8Q42_01685 [Nanoarchaeota archaeon]|nr:hypothetical protein [Nanoarchaeota archaeon]